MSKIQGKLQVFEKLCVQSTPTRVPFIADNVLDEYAQKVVGAFAPLCLSKPAPFDVEAFLLFGLELTILRHHINLGGKSLAVTAFVDDCVQVYDKEARKVRPQFVERGTVIADKSLYVAGNEARLRFTYAHEAAHWLLHTHFFAEGCRRNCGLGGDVVGGSDGGVGSGACGGIGCGCCPRRKFDIARVERQADIFAAALLMPKSALKIAFADFFRGLGQKPRVLVRGLNADEDKLIKTLVAHIAKTFGVSNCAAMIRLEKLRAIVGLSAFTFNSI